MKYLMLVVRLLDMLTGSGFYELTRYSNGTGLNLSTSKFMAWRRRTARRLWSLDVQFFVPFILIFMLLSGTSPLLIFAGFGFGLAFLVIVMALIVFFPPIALALI